MHARNTHTDTHTRARAHTHTPLRTNANHLSLLPSLSLSRWATEVRKELDFRTEATNLERAYDGIMRRSGGSVLLAAWLGVLA